MNPILTQSREAQRWDRDDLDHLRNELGSMPWFVHIDDPYGDEDVETVESYLPHGQVHYLPEFPYMCFNDRHLIRGWSDLLRPATGRPRCRQCAREKFKRSYARKVAR